MLTANFLLLVPPPSRSRVKRDAKRGNETGEEREGGTNPKGERVIQFPFPSKFAVQGCVDEAHNWRYTFGIS